MGTFETLTTAPVKDWQVVLSKFFGVVIFYVLLLAPTLPLLPAFNWITGGKAAVQSAGAYGSTYLLLLLLGMFFICIGCLAQFAGEGSDQRGDHHLRDDPALPLRPEPPEPDC